MSLVTSGADELVTLLGATIGGSLVLAQAAPQSPAEWLNYGLAGLVAVSLIVGWFVPGWLYKRESARADRLEGELRRRDEYLAEEVVPVLTRVADALAVVADRPRDRDR